MRARIMLDAGHDGKYNRSPAVKEYYESDFNFRFCNMLKEELEVLGFEVGLTRKTQDEKLELVARGKASEGYDLFLSIHSNATGSGKADEKVDYPVAIVMLNDEKVDIDEISLEIGKKLAAVVEEVMQTKQAGRTYTRQSVNDRDGNGIKDDEYYGVLHGAKRVRTPGIIMEHSFHTNTRATKWLLNEDNLRTMAKAEAAVLAEHFGTKEQEPMTLWYHVPLEAGMRIETLKDYPAYNSADQAKKAGATSLLYRAGSYYIYKVYNGVANITKKKGVPGAWVVL